jgi:2',3'-cyclic-nucleotide 2'-phosphodiesterase (5'-nucleotidase family)
VILVDAGNMFGTAGEEMRRQTRFLAQETAGLGYHVAGVGPWELNHGLEFLRDVNETTDLEFTSANLLQNGEPIFPAYEIVEAGGVRVGLISVCDDELSAPASEMLTDGVAIEPASEAIRRILPELRKQSDVVVLLSNLKKGKTEALLQTLPASGIDVAIEGYANVRTEKPRQVGATTVLAANSQGKYLGQLDLTMVDGEIGDRRFTLHAVDPKERKREEMAERVRQFKEEVEELATR